MDSSFIKKTNKGIRQILILANKQHLGNYVPMMTDVPEDNWKLVRMVHNRIVRTEKEVECKALLHKIVGLAKAYRAGHIPANLLK